MREEIEKLLPLVQKPAQYVGGEYGAIYKENPDTRFCFCFPDLYEIGMSHLGLRILYGVINEMDGVWCERAFAPKDDFEKLLREKNLALFALESGDELSKFDIVGFTLQYELCYSAVLNMLELGGITLHSSERGENEPLVIAGGPCTYNPEPMADFIDAFCIGEGEETLPRLINVYKAHTGTRRELLKKLSEIPGVYVPSLYEISYNPDGTIAKMTPPDKIVKTIITDLDKVYFPVKPIVPSTEIVHDRVVLEVFRGCIRGCRFCQAGFAYRPVRAKSAKTLISQAKLMCENSGYEEISLSSLSTSDYKELEALCDGLMDYCEPRSISLQLPSLRADNFSLSLMERVSRVRKSSLTFAPEAGSARLRDAINKNLTEQDILNACKVAFEGGWNSVKLYFMIGLPTETDEDILGIAELANKVLYTWRQNAKYKSKGVKITVSVACFVPKPATPFQWFGQNTREEFARKISLLREAMTAKSVTLRWHEPTTSVLEAVMARGDRRLGRVIEYAHQNGAHLDGWEDCFDIGHWNAAFSKCGLTPDFYANRERALDELLPWEHISTGVTKKHLMRELELCYKSESSPNCREKCAGCGASSLSGGVCDE